MPKPADNPYTKLRSVFLLGLFHTWRTTTSEPPDDGRVATAETRHGVKINEVT